MNTITLYHGTMSLNINEVVDYPKASKSINGFGFYCTLDAETARGFGRVIAWVLTKEQFDELEYTQRPIDQRYTEGLATYAECASYGMEVVLTQRSAGLMAVNAIAAGELEEVNARYMMEASNV
tara:strand:+ start:594 stop:965 length:372 start_codon:yes stop_codon:yes gene_type:complete